jgi:hypothetical protein
MVQKLNPSIKHHVIIGFLLSLWIFLFAYIIRPFEHGEMDNQRWMNVSLGFSIIPFICYVIIAFFQKSVFQLTKRWTSGQEIFIYILFYSFYTIGTYAYYLSPPVSGFYTFWEFFLYITLKVVLILTPVIYLARRYSLKLIPDKNEEIITITGENKLDVLKIKQFELVCISNAQNYIEIYYLGDEELQTKLMRTTLKKMKMDFPFLLQIHRSHLINPVHFKSWKDASTIQLTKIELPVSKSYKNQLSHL